MNSEQALQFQERRENNRRSGRKKDGIQKNPVYGSNSGGIIRGDGSRGGGSEKGRVSRKSGEKRITEVGVSWHFHTIDLTRENIRLIPVGELQYRKKEAQEKNRHKVMYCREERKSIIVVDGKM